LLAGWIFTAAAATAEPVFIEQFEGPLPSWQMGPADTKPQVLAHQRVRSPVHSGSWSESLRIFGQGGSYAYAIYDIGRAQVIDELALSVWLRSDRPGLQLAARVVLPRTRDSDTGKPLTLRIYGDQYRDAGRWQQVFLDRVLQRVLRQTRIVQSGRSQWVDHREAYIDRVLINVYGGAGTTTVWIDDLEVEGFVGKPKVPIQTTAQDSTRRARPDRGDLPVRLRESQLTVSGKPFFPLIIEYQGEPFSFLKDKGFNTILMRQPPTAEQMHWADQNDLWLLVPPPDRSRNVVVDGRTRQADQDTLKTFVPKSDPRPPDRILGWYFGDDLDCLQAGGVHHGLLTNSIPSFVAKKLTVGRIDPQTGRGPCDIGLLNRCPIGTTLELSDYAAWLQESTGHNGKRSIYWNAVSTQFPQTSELPLPLEPEFDNIIPPRKDLSYQQLRTLVTESVTAGARGLVFLSTSPLNDPAADNLRRSNSLELINLELSLIGPLLADGQSSTAVRCHPAEIEATAVRSGHTHLVFPAVRAAGSQYVEKPAPTEPVAFVVPGVPAAARAYALSPFGLQPLNQKRVAGGTRIELPRLESTTVLLLTDEAKIIRRIAQQLTGRRPHAEELFSAIVKTELQSLKNTNRQLGPLLRSAGNARREEQAERLWQQAETARELGDLRRARQHEQELLRQTTTAKRKLWEDAAGSLGPPSRLASLARFETLPEAYAWTHFAARAQLSENLLAAGKMESPAAVRSAGWQLLASADPAVETTMEISQQAGHSGRSCLHLHAHRAALSEFSSELPSLTVVSPEILATAGQFYEIRAQVRTAGMVPGGPDKLLVYDSCGGPRLATRLREASKWQVITLYRRAVPNQPFTVCFALHGSGHAWIDDLSVRRLESSTSPPDGRTIDTIFANPGSIADE
jgi:hypothetical protein